MLKKLYKEKMKQLHPDKHTLKPLQEQEEAGKHASDMTRAYETIKNDYDRALHLLKLEGYPMEENFSVRIYQIIFFILYYSDEFPFVILFIISTYMKFICTFLYRVISWVTHFCWKSWS